MDELIYLGNKDAKKTGRSLVNAAKEERRKQFGESIVKEVSEMMAHLDRLKFNRDKCDKEIEWTQNRIDAIDAGNFEIIAGRVCFTEPSLNVHP